MSLSRSLLSMLFAFMVLVNIGNPVDGGTAYAQSSLKTKPIEGTDPGFAQGNESGAELWRKIRKGDSGNVAGGDNPNAGVMIQSQGEEWRKFRNGPLPLYTTWAILGMCVLLCLFFAVRGRIKIHGGKSGNTILRFSTLERAAHWLLASSFIVLALTGLNLIFGKSLLLPIFGAKAFSWLTLMGKYAHNYVGFAFMFALALVFILWLMQNLPSRSDVKWLAKGGGMFGGKHPPAKKFNAGQKILFWLVMLCGLSISLSGWALLNPFSTDMFGSTFGIVNAIFGTEWSTTLAPIQEQQYQSIWHSVMAVFMIVVILGHIYIGSVGMEGALDAMTTGEVDENWAKEHHSLWVEEVATGADSGEQASGSAQPAE